MTLCPDIVPMASILRAAAVEVRRVAEGEQSEHTRGHHVGIAASTHHPGMLPVVRAVGSLARPCPTGVELIANRVAQAVDGHAHL